MKKPSLKRRKTELEAHKFNQTERRHFKDSNFSESSMRIFEMAVWQPVIPKVVKQPTKISNLTIMKTMNLEQMERVVGGAYSTGKCVAGMVSTTIAWAGLVCATGGAFALFAVAALGFGTSMSGTAESCGWW